MNNKIRIKLSAYDHNLLDRSVHKIITAVRPTGADVVGPIPLPTKQKIFTVLRAPHINKRSREQFKLTRHRRLLDLYSSGPPTVSTLMKLEMSSGIEISIKV